LCVFVRRFIESFLANLFLPGCSCSSIVAWLQAFRNSSRATRDSKRPAIGVTGEPQPRSITSIRTRSRGCRDQTLADEEHVPHHAAEQGRFELFDNELGGLITSGRKPGKIANTVVASRVNNSYGWLLPLTCLLVVDRRVRVGPSHLPG
jgi:hypothetical protein